MFEAAAVPAVAFLVGALLIPESPRWLGRRGRWDEARAVLLRFDNDNTVDEVLRAMRVTFAQATSDGVADTLRRPRVRHALLIGIVLAVLQQWCGINVIFNYAQEVFAAAGYALSSILINIVITDW